MFCTTLQYFMFYVNMCMGHFQKMCTFEVRNVEKIKYLRMILYCVYHIGSVYMNSEIAICKLNLCSFSQILPEPRVISKKRQCCYHLNNLPSKWICNLIKKHKYLSHVQLT